MPFSFDGNHYFGLIEKPVQLQTLLERYSLNEIKKAKSRKMFNGAIAFGFYSEYTESPTLGEWIEANNLSVFFEDAAKIENKNISISDEE